MKPLEEGLEGMLEQGKLPERDTPEGAYLAANPETRAEVVEMMELSRLIRENFRLSAEELEEAEPLPGFYARVMARIEAEVQPSVWNFVFQPFARRIVYASMALAVLLLAVALWEPMPDAGEDTTAQVAMETLGTPGGAPVPMDADGPTHVLGGAILASDGDGLPAVESSNAVDNRGSMLMQLRTYEQ